MSRALVVDDQRKMRRVLQILLEQIGLESVPVDSGEAAVEHFGAEKFDLVLTDLAMPRVSGVDVIQAIKTNKATAHLPVVAVTAHATPEDRQRALRSGFTEYLTKPFRPRDLLHLVERLLAHD